MQFGITVRDELRLDQVRRRQIEQLLVICIVLLGQLLQHHDGAAVDVRHPAQIEDNRLLLGRRVDLLAVGVAVDEVETPRARDHHPPVLVDRLHLLLLLYPSHPPFSTTRLVQQTGDQQEHPRGGDAADETRLGAERDGAGGADDEAAEVGPAGAPERCELGELGEEGEEVDDDDGGERGVGDVDDDAGEQVQADDDQQWRDEVVQRGARLCE